MTEQAAFVGRASEIASLNSFLDKARRANGQICFITGEAGSGKTTLVTEFASQAQASDETLVVAMGQCDSQTGTGSAYLPFREILDMLTGSVDAKSSGVIISEENASRLQTLVRTSGEAILELAPDLIGLFVPWAGLVIKLGTFAAQKGRLPDRLQELLRRREASSTSAPASVDQDQIFEQYVNLLRALACNRTLVLVIDDLQWADASSLQLLFRLGRRLQGVSILVIGTYRPAEVALGRDGERHPLDKIVLELQRYFGDISIDLDLSRATDGLRFVGQLLDAEPNLLDASFREALHRHTGGNALFTVELLHSMRERGDLTRDSSGRWVLSSAFHWAALPARVEGVIEERIHRLHEDMREVLTVASVEGSGFTAEVIARICNLEARLLVRSLSGELEKRHRLVVSQGVQQIGSNRLSRYRFLHDLFHQYLYSGLAESERVYLHEDVALVLEEMYGDRADDICVQLAHHFEVAGIIDKARCYLSAAGHQAAGQYANQEALHYLSRALDLTPHSALDDRFLLLLTRERVYGVLGQRECQASDLRALVSLASTIDDFQGQATVALRRALYAESGSDFADAIAASQEAIALSERAEDVQGRARGHLQWGRALWRQGDYSQSADQLQHALGLSEQSSSEALVADCLSNLGVVHWYRGELLAGREYLERALSARASLDDRLGEAHVYNNLAGVSYEVGDHSSAIEYQERALDLYRQTGYRRGRALALSNLSVFISEKGRYLEALSLLEQSLETYREIGDREGETAALINLGIISDTLGNYDAAREFLARSMDISQRTGDIKGTLETSIYASLVSHHLGQDTEARLLAERAVSLATESDDARSESHALLHLGHSLAATGQWSEATDAYSRSAGLRQGAGEHHRAVEAKAGLARVGLANGDMDSAQSLVEEIMVFLRTDTLEGTDEPIRIYLTCFKVLRELGDARAEQVLVDAHELLEQRANLIEDHETRGSYLRNPPSHRDLGNAWANLHEP